MTVDVLVVEPDEVERTALGGMLRRAGCEVTAVGSAEEALYERAQRDLDAVVTALELGGMDGIELCRVLALESPVAVVVVDRRPSSPAAVEALDAGADDIIGPGQLGE
jgi:DNA-binding response OmpR family regulator